MSPLYQSPEDEQAEKEIIRATFGRYSDADFEWTEKVDYYDARVTLPSLGRVWLVEAKDRLCEKPDRCYTLGYMRRNKYKVDKDKVDLLVKAAKAEGATPMLAVRTYDLFVMLWNPAKLSDVNIDPAWQRQQDYEKRHDAPDTAYIIPVDKVIDPGFADAAVERARKHDDMRLFARRIFRGTFPGDPS